MWLNFKTTPVKTRLRPRSGKFAILVRLELYIYAYTDKPPPSGPPDFQRTVQNNNTQIKATHQLTSFLFNQSITLSQFSLFLN